jgi:hypothetical protein
MNIVYQSLDTHWIHISTATYGYMAIACSIWEKRERVRLGETLKNKRVSD